MFLELFGLVNLLFAVKVAFYKPSLAQQSAYCPTFLVKCLTLLYINKNDLREFRLFLQLLNKVVLIAVDYWKLL